MDIFWWIGATVTAGFALVGIYLLLIFIGFAYAGIRLAYLLTRPGMAHRSMASDPIKFLAFAVWLVMNPAWANVFLRTAEKKKDD